MYDNIWTKGEGIKKKTHRHITVTTREKGGSGEVEEGIGGINGDGKVLDLAGEHTIQFIDNVLQNCRPETYIILLTNIIPINSIKNNIAI